MGQLLVALGPGVRVTPAEFAAAWNADEEARATGVARENAPVTGGAFQPDLLTTVVITVLAELGTAVTVHLVLGAIGRARRKPATETEFELLESESANGDRIVAVKLRQTHHDNSH